MSAIDEALSPPECGTVGDVSLCVLPPAVGTTNSMPATALVATAATTRPATRGRRDFPAVPNRPRAWRPISLTTRRVTAASANHGSERAIRRDTGSAKGALHRRTAASSPTEHTGGGERAREAQASRPAPEPGAGRDHGGHPLKHRGAEQRGPERQGLQDEVLGHLSRPLQSRRRLSPDSTSVPGDERQARIAPTVAAGARSSQSAAPWAPTTVEAGATTRQVLRARRPRRSRRWYARQGALSPGGQHQAYLPVAAGGRRPRSTSTIDLAGCCRSALAEQCHVPPGPTRRSVCLFGCRGNPLASMSPPYLLAETGPPGPPPAPFGSVLGEPGVDRVPVRAPSAVRLSKSG